MNTMSRVVYVSTHGMRLLSDCGDIELKLVDGWWGNLLRPRGLTHPPPRAFCSTCSTVGDANMPVWGEVANQIVVQEMKIIGSRCVAVSHAASGT